MRYDRDRQFLDRHATFIVPPSSPARAEVTPPARPQDTADLTGTERPSAGALRNPNSVRSATQAPLDSTQKASISCVPAVMVGRWRRGDLWCSPR